MTQMLRGKMAKVQNPYRECFNCGRVGTVQRHHLFRTEIRRKQQYKMVFIEWETKEGKIVRTKIPINAKVYACEYCHMLNHPENQTYYLNKFIAGQVKKNRGE